jgi:hypothetical protein
MPHYWQNVRNMTHSPEYWEVSDCVYDVMREGTDRPHPDMQNCSNTKVRCS